MTIPKVYITRVIPQEGLDKVSNASEVRLWTGELPPSRDTIREQVRDVDGLLCLLTDKIDAAVMASAPN